MVITEELIFNGKESRLDDRFEERRKGGGEDKISYLFLDKSLCIIEDKKSWTTPLVEGKPSV